MKRTARQVEDELLVLARQNGEASAIDQLVVRWQQSILSHAWRLTGDVEAAREVAQESWLAILKGIRTLHDPASFRPSAYRIISRRCADWIRRVRGRSEVGEVELSTPAAHGSAVAQVCPLDRGCIPDKSDFVLKGSRTGDLRAELECGNGKNRTPRTAPVTSTRGHSPGVRR